MAALKKASDLTMEGKRVLRLLVERYGMTELNAIKLMRDGGAPLAAALLAIQR